MISSSRVQNLYLWVAYHVNVVDHSAAPHRQHSDIVQASLAASLWKTLGGVNVIVKVVLSQSWLYRLIEWVWPYLILLPIDVNVAVAVFPLLMSSSKGVQRQLSALRGRGDAKHIEGDRHQSGTARGDWRKTIEKWMWFWGRFMKMIEKWKWFWGRLPQKTSLMTMFATVDSRSYSSFFKGSECPSEILLSTF